jgi:flagellar basal-body rod modification protein FlgD
MLNEPIRDMTDAPYNPGGPDRTSEAQGMGKEAFLKLLVTQLGNQDPMAPSDPTRFVTELAQFTSLEQLVGVNEGLDILAIGQAASTSAQMVSFVGKEVWVDDSSFFMAKAGEEEQLHFKLEDNASTVKVDIKNEAGELVRSLELGALGKGDATVDFDGRDRDGNPLPQGMYTFNVTAEDEEGGPVSVETRSTGVVSAVTFDKGYPQLQLEDGRTMALSQILHVKEHVSDDSSDEENNPTAPEVTVEEMGNSDPTLDDEIQTGGGVVSDGEAITEENNPSNQEESA